MQSEACYIGLMSGTSMDGIDAALVSFPDQGLKLHATHSVPYPHDLRERLHRLSQNQGGPDEIGEMDHQLGVLFGEAAQRVMEAGNLTSSEIAAIGSHGQTIRHQPRGQCSFSLQLGDPNIIVEQTGIATIADFRRRDMAAGGEGAPLVPAFHRAFFGKSGENRCIVNIGGIANISWLPGDDPDQASGFDTGPGNALMDAWCHHHTGRHYDENGRLAQEGEINEDLLEDMLSDGYFAQAAPKSTGKEKFNLAWIQTVLSRHPELSMADVQRTLLQLTVTTIAQQLDELPAEMVYLCGGGVRNPELVAALTQACPRHQIASTDALGMDPQWVEATAFGWLARQTLNANTGNLPKVTGARGKRILGAIYQP
ncbi:anhydro-N-acetylmuramic acid kinase [Marinobacter sp.]|uniref:anhydro-N-acetylmuramic acid kinase n=1 Tax=Marinobacter sp. TaxID=50741 RepID=UPI00384B18C2